MLASCHTATLTSDPTQARVTSLSRYISPVVRSAGPTRLRPASHASNCHRSGVVGRSVLFWCTLSRIKINNTFGIQKIFFLLRRASNSHDKSPLFPSIVALSHTSTLSFTQEHERKPFPIKCRWIKLKNSMPLIFLLVTVSSLPCTNLATQSKGMSTV